MEWKHKPHPRSQWPALRVRESSGKRTQRGFGPNRVAYIRIIFAVAEAVRRWRVGSFKRVIPSRLATVLTTVST